MKGEIEPVTAITKGSDIFGYRVAFVRLCCAVSSIKGNYIAVVYMYLHRVNGRDHIFKCKGVYDFYTERSIRCCVPLNTSDMYSYFLVETCSCLLRLH